MDILHNLAIGFGAAATPLNLLFCLFGCLIGTLIGVLPGIGPIATIAMPRTRMAVNSRSNDVAVSLTIWRSGDEIYKAGNRNTMADAAADSAAER